MEGKKYGDDNSNLSGHSYSVNTLDQIDEHYRTLPGTSNDRLSEYGYNARGEVTAENVVTGGLLSANHQDVWEPGAEYFYT